MKMRMNKMVNRHVVLAVFEYFPATHGLQALMDIAPGELEALPAVQSVHWPDVVAPLIPEYFPATQFVHELALIDALFGLYFPEAHSLHDGFLGVGVVRLARACMLYTSETLCKRVRECILILYYSFFCLFLDEFPEPLFKVF